MKKGIKFLSFIYMIIIGYAQGSQNVRPYQIVLSFKKNTESNPPSIKNQFSRPFCYSQKQNPAQLNPTHKEDMRNKTAQEIKTLTFNDPDSRILVLFDLFKKEYNLNDTVKLDDKPRLFLSFLISHRQFTRDDVETTLKRIKENNPRFIIDYKTLYKPNIQAGDTTPTQENFTRFCSINDEKIQYIFQTMLEDALIAVSKQ